MLLKRMKSKLTNFDTKFIENQKGCKNLKTRLLKK